MPKYLIKKNNEYSVVLAQGFVPRDVVSIVSDTFAEEDLKFLKTRTVMLDGQETVEVYVDDVAKGVHLSNQSKSHERSLAREAYISDIEAEMFRIFGSTNRDKTAAFYNMWKAWVLDPAFFSVKGLKDEHGDPLDTASKVSMYAQQKIEQAKDYSVFLLKREEQYLEQLEQIG